MTVIITGAGASKPFGFPLGNELKNLFINATGTGNHRLQKLGYSKDILDDIIDKLQHSRFGTIDEFLEAKTSFREVGGCIIAEAILRREDKETIFTIRDWHVPLIEKLLRKFRDNIDPNIAFITLNYDRSLEYLFDNVAKYDCRENEEDAFHKYLGGIPIIHAHGTLGSLGELPYGKDHSSLTPEMVSSAGKRIQIISDNLEDAKSYQQAVKIISDAKCIYFLGFGYHPSTLDGLLRKVSRESPPIILGTGLSVPPERSEHIKNWDGPPIKLLNQNVKKFLESVDF